MPTLRVEFSNFDHIILIVDGKQVNVTKEYFEISMDYEIHDIEVQNLANINSTSFCATGYRPRIKLLNPVTKERVVNHILAFSTNYKMCVWKGKLKIHRSAILQFKANTYEFDNFLYVKWSNRCIFIYTLNRTCRAQAEACPQRLLFLQFVLSAPHCLYRIGIRFLFRRRQGNILRFRCLSLSRHRLY